MSVGSFPSSLNVAVDFVQRRADFFSGVPYPGILFFPPQEDFH